MGCCCSRESNNSLIPLFPFSVFEGPQQEDGLLQTNSAPQTARRGLEADVPRIASSPGFYEDPEVRAKVAVVGSASSPSTQVPIIERKLLVSLADEAAKGKCLPSEGGSAPLEEGPWEEISLSEAAPTSTAVRPAQVAVRPAQVAVNFQPGFLHLRAVTMNLEDSSATSSTCTPAVTHTDSFGSTASGNDRRHRDDFGAGFGGNCGECGRRVYANRGCRSCKIHICKTCFQSHECTTYAASRSKPASAGGLQ
mmetsp:Transcript_59048/g.104950  ORF Transcript_59048/g.104950 Transcript_59048/m.104950 type:complete len:252 (+) Transcript_59048:59-814(+)